MRTIPGAKQLLTYSDINMVMEFDKITYAIHIFKKRGGDLKKIDGFKKAGDKWELILKPEKKGVDDNG
jgi:hypothetical protein